MFMSGPTKDQIRRHVRNRYRQIALLEADAGAGCRSSSGCCAPSPEISHRLGYSAEDLSGAPEGSYLGLGCGNPLAAAELRPGETVLDLGSGGGFDCFLAARRVGENGRVIGVDMTPEMIDRARANAAKGGYSNVEFRLGEIEHLPVADGSVDVILSNCVINLSPDKPQVLREAYRVLKPGGRLAIADVVLTAELPPELKNDPDAHSRCIAGALSVEDWKLALEQCGFTRIAIETKDESRAPVSDWLPGTRLEDVIVSAVIKAEKP